MKFTQNSCIFITNSGENLAGIVVEITVIFSIPERKDTCDFKRLMLHIIKEREINRRRYLLSFICVAIAGVCRLL